jgi:hypothetical protein
MVNREYKGILFDLDRTPIEALDLISSSYGPKMPTHLGHVPPDEAWLSTLGMPLRVQLKSFIEDPSPPQYWVHDLAEPLAIPNFDAED